MKNISLYNFFSYFALAERKLKMVDFQNNTNERFSVVRIWGAVFLVLWESGELCNGVKLKHKNLVPVLNKISTAKGSPKLKLDGLPLFIFTLTKG